MSALVTLRVEEGSVIGRSFQGLHAIDSHGKIRCGVALSEADSVTDEDGIIGAWIDDREDRHVCLKCVNIAVNSLLDFAQETK